MINSERTSELILNQELTDPPGTSGKVDPPESCLLCLVPHMGLVACEDYMVPEIVVIEAAFTGIENIVSRFGDHAHTETAGPPEIDKCFYTGASGARYADTSGYAAWVDVAQYWKMSWTPGSTTGVLSVHADFYYDTFWGKGYSLEILNTTYADQAAFIAAVDAEVARQLRRTLTGATATGTAPGSMVAPSTIELIHA